MTYELGRFRDISTYRKWSSLKLSFLNSPLVATMTSGEFPKLYYFLVWITHSLAIFEFTWAGVTSLINDQIVHMIQRRTLSSGSFFVTCDHCVISSFLPGKTPEKGGFSRSWPIPWNIPTSRIWSKSRSSEDQIVRIGDSTIIMSWIYRVWLCYCSVPPNQSSSTLWELAQLHGYSHKGNLISTGKLLPINNIICWCSYVRNQSRTSTQDVNKPAVSTLHSDSQVFFYHEVSSNFLPDSQ
jgi:hypothetical protein